MSDPPRPHLIAVDDETSAPPPAPQPELQRPTGRSPWTWRLAVALLASGVALVLQTQRTLGLEAEVEYLSGQLQAAQEEIEGFQGHLESVRERVSALIGELEALDGFVSEGPPPADR